MPSGRADSLADVPLLIRALLDEVPRGVMSTINDDGSPHSVPVVFALAGEEIVSPIDHKPKTGTVMYRVRNLERDDRVTLLVDYYDDEWTRLRWLMISGRARLDTDYPDELGRALNARYPQYEPDERHDALVRITPERLRWWSWADLAQP